jgi:hypothetical protein
MFHVKHSLADRLPLDGLEVLPATLPPALVRSDRPPFAPVGVSLRSGCAEPNHRQWSDRAPAVPELLDSMSRVRTQGPESDLCRRCQLMRFGPGGSRQFRIVPASRSRWIRRPNGGRRSNRNRGAAVSRVKRSSRGWDVAPAVSIGIEAQDVRVIPPRIGPGEMFHVKHFTHGFARAASCVTSRADRLAWRCMWDGFSRSPTKRVA